MKKKDSPVANKISVKTSYYQETVVEPAERLLNVLMETETKEKGVTNKIRKTAISR